MGITYAESYMGCEKQGLVVTIGIENFETNSLQLTVPILIMTS